MFIDPNPTTTDNPIVTDVDLKAYQVARSVTPPTLPAPPAPAPQMEEETPAPSALPSVTEMEVAALKGIDAVEQVADPLNRFNAARASVKLAAWVARKLR